MLQEKTEEQEFSTGPLSVLTMSVKNNSQVSTREGELTCLWEVSLLVISSNILSYRRGSDKHHEELR